MKRISKYTIVLIIIILIGTFVRFYNIDWGDNHFFHPDERNIGIAVSNINIERGDYNPDFFAYGSFPIYMLYIISKGQFEITLIAGRYLSAGFSVLSLYLIYLITKRLLISMFVRDRETIKSTKKIESYALLATLLASLSPALIQFAHFTTFESFLTFEYLLFTLLSIKLLSKPTLINFLLVALVMGLAVGTKIVSLFLIVVFFLLFVFTILNTRRPELNKYKFLINFPFEFLNFKYILSTILAVAIFILTNPFIFLDYNSYQGSMDYERGVATGTLSVFYNQQFIETIPVVYQFLYVFPSLMGWPLTLFSFISILFLLIYCIRYGIKYLIANTHINKLPLVVFLLVGSGYTLFHFTMYVKWSRYMVPTVPFLIISFIIVFANLSYKRYKFLRNFSKVTIIFVSLFSIIQGLNFFTIYLKPDPRLEAARWLAENSQSEDTFAGEVYDMGMTAFNEKLGTHRITEFDYYHLDDSSNDTAELVKLDQLISESEFIIVPAERIYPTRARLSKKYPNGYNHYKQLFAGELGFVKVAEFTRTTYLEDLFNVTFYSGGLMMPLNYDETFRVFDQPTVSIFKKSI